MPESENLTNLSIHLEKKKKISAHFLHGLEVLVWPSYSLLLEFSYLMACWRMPPYIVSLLIPWFSDHTVLEAILNIQSKVGPLPLIHDMKSDFSPYSLY